MGATGWSYFTPFVDDVGAALHRLRQEVFESGRYGQAAVLDSAYSELSRFPTAAGDAGALEAAHQSLRVLQTLESQRIGGGASRFQTIEALLEAAGDSGTHSILDIRTTGAAPAFATATPADARRVTELFGSATPTHADILGKEGLLTEEVERWQAVYVIVYDRGRPSEYYFEGVSGD